MKTGLFYSVGAKPDFARQFLGDLMAVFRISPEQRVACIDALLDLEETMTRRQSRTIAERVAKELNLGLVETVSVLQSLHFLMKELADEQNSGDSTGDFAADLLEIANEHDIHVPDTAVPVFADLINRIRGVILPKYNKVKEKKKTAAGVLPSIKSFGTTVEFRAITGNEFRIGMSADEYEPNVTGLVPVISVALRVDAGPVERFSFQASEAELGALIEELRSALVCLRHAKRIAGMTDR